MACLAERARAAAMGYILEFGVFEFIGFRV